MEREWKPGDVAMVRWQTFPEVRGMYINGQWEDADDAVFDGHEDDLRIRPLVVIDPEDREQVARLESLYLRDTHDGCEDTTDCMQDALREYANPTPDKPEEPTGLGAVVEDADGERWIRHEHDPGRRGRSHAWYPAGYVGLPPRTAWSDVSAVRILSEGVTQ